MIVCVQLRHMEHHDGNIYIKYAMGNKAGKFKFFHVFPFLSASCYEDKYFFVLFLGWFHSGHHHYYSYGSADALLLLQSIKVHKVHT